MIRHGGGRFTLPLAQRRKATTVEQVLEDMGYWYPPDAIQAVREKRNSYHPIDTSVTYELYPEIRERIQAALDKLEHGTNYLER